MSHVLSVLARFFREMQLLAGGLPVELVLPDAVFDRMVAETNAYEHLGFDQTKTILTLDVNTPDGPVHVRRFTNPDRALAAIRCARCHRLVRPAIDAVLENVEVLGLCLQCRSGLPS